MYDKEMLEKICLSPFLSWLNEDVIRKEMTEGFEARVRSIVVEPYLVPMLKEVAKAHQNGYTRLGMTLGYPYGGFTTEIKLMLMRYAVEMAVDEVDVGININAVLSGDFSRAKDELRQLVEIGEGKLRIVPLGWVIRNSLETISNICNMFLECGIRAIKTNPGGHFGDMQVEHIEYLHRHFPELEIEVAGRCRTRQKAELMYLAGASSFHLSSWKRIGGIGDDIQFDYTTKKAEYGAYRDRLG